MIPLPVCGDWTWTSWRGQHLLLPSLLLLGASACGPAPVMHSWPVVPQAFGAVITKQVRQGRQVVVLVAGPVHLDPEAMQLTGM